jgi:hypothetical protein
MGYDKGARVVQSVLLAILGTICNDFGGGNDNWLVRNSLNAAGFTSFASGTLEVAWQSPVSKSMIGKRFVSIMHG